MSLSPLHICRLSKIQLLPNERVCAARSALQLSPPPYCLLPSSLPLSVRALFNPDLKIINQTIDQVLTMAWEWEGAEAAGWMRFGFQQRASGFLARTSFPLFFVMQAPRPSFRKLGLVWRLLVHDIVGDASIGRGLTD